MNVTPIVNKGLSFDLKSYQELKTARSGAHFWYIDNGKLLRTKLAPFLPRMEYDATAGTVTASIVENGQELLSTSEAATPSLNNVPVSELQKLETLINELLAEVSKDETPDNVKQLVNAFPLPKPNSMPECYRLYGNGPNKKLAIVWGLARKDSEGKEDVSSVVALKDFTYGLEYTPKKSYTWLWILLGIAAAGIAIYCTTDTKGSLTHSPTPADNPPVESPEVINVDPVEVPVVLTPEEEQLPTPEKIEILKGKETAVQQEIDKVVKQQEELKAKIATMDQQSAEAKAARAELDALLAKHELLEKNRKAIQTRREELENELINVYPEDYPEEGPVVLTPEEEQLPTPEKIEILKGKETAVQQEIDKVVKQQEELKAKIATMDQQSAEAKAARAELDDLLAKHELLEKNRKAIQTRREELEKELPKVIETPEPPVVINDDPVEVPVVLTPEEEQLPTPEKIEILKGKETAVQQEIDKVVKQQEELKAKIATMDQQSAEAKTAKEELNALQTKHGELEKNRKAIQTRREELEKELPKVIETPEPPVVINDDPVEVPVVLTPEEEQLPTPEKIEILKGKETAVQQEIDKVVKQQEELKAKIETMDQQSAEAKTAKEELDALQTKHGELEKNRKAIQTRREELEKELPKVIETPEPPVVINDDPVEVPVVLTPEEEQLPTPEKIEILKGKETAVQQEIDEVVKQQEELKAKIETMDQQSDEAKTAKEELDALQTKHGELEKNRKAIQTRREKLEKELPKVIETPEPPVVINDDPVELPTPEKIEILEKKEQDIRTEIKELEAEQKQLENELDAILARQKEQVEEYRQLKAMLEDSEKLAEKLDQSDLSDNERAELTQKKNELEMKINEAKQKLGTDTYLLNRERLNNIDARLKELDKESKQIIEARKTLKSAPAVTGIQPPDTKAPEVPEVIQKVVNVVINQSTDYKVTYVSNTPLAGTDQVLVKLNVSPIKPGLKFSKVTVESKEVDANGNVELEIQDSATQELQLKIWVDNQADPKYSAPIPVSTSVTE